MADMDYFAAAGEAFSGFDVNCENWKDTNEPPGKLKYSYSYAMKGDTTHFTTTHPVFPLGDPEDDYRITILVDIKNQYGAVVSYSMSVKVSHVPCCLVTDSSY